jgi:hypothetical protein
VIPFGQFLLGWLETPFISSQTQLIYSYGSALLAVIAPLPSSCNVLHQSPLHEVKDRQASYSVKFWLSEKSSFYYQDYATCHWQEHSQCHRYYQRSRFGSVEPDAFDCSCDWGTSQQHSSSCLWSLHHSSGLKSWSLQFKTSHDQILKSLGLAPLNHLVSWSGAPSTFYSDSTWYWTRTNCNHSPWFISNK